MQDITQIYDHSEYGEAYDGMARHVSAMSGLDRIIFEDCDLVSGKVCAPHENLVPYPHWLSVDYVAHKCGCSYKEAKDLLECWLILDATQEMVETFIKWTKLKAVNDLDRLICMGKEAYQLSMTKDQAGVFWTEYNIQKARLESKIKLGPVARIFIKRIAKANGNLASLGAYLYKVQKGEVKVANPPTTHEWKLIWKAYQERKEVHEYV